MDLIIIQGKGIASEIEELKELLGECNCEIIADETDYNFINTEIIFEALAGIATVIQFVLWGKEFVYDRINQRNQHFVKNNMTYNVDNIKEDQSSDGKSTDYVVTVKGKDVIISIETAEGIHKIEIKNQIELTS